MQGQVRIKVLLKHENWAISREMLHVGLCVRVGEWASRATDKNGMLILCALRQRYMSVEELLMNMIDGLQSDILVLLQNQSPSQSTRTCDKYVNDLLVMIIESSHQSLMSIRVVLLIQDSLRS